MVAVPRITQERVDGGLGSVVDGVDGRFAVAALASAGPYTPQLVTSLAALVALYTSGSLVDLAAYLLSLTGRPVLCQRIVSSQAGVSGTVLYSGAGASGNTLTAGGGNTSTAVPTISGLAVTPVNVMLRITIAASNIAAGTARYQYSLDGGLTYSAATAPALTAVDLGETGLTIAWADGTFVVSGGSWAGSALPGAQQGTVTAAVTGNPADAYDVRLKIVRGGATLVAATTTYLLSLDGGDTWGAETAMPVGGTVVPAGTGLTITFTYSSGTAFVADDVFAFQATAPTFNSTTMANAYNLLDLGDDEWEAVLFSGAFDSALCTSLETLLTASEVALRYHSAIVGVRDRTPEESVSTYEAAIRTDFTGWTGVHVVPCAGHAEVLSPATQRYNRRSSAVVVAGRAASVPISEDLAWVERGPLPGVTAIYYDGAEHPSLNDFGFTTLQKRKSRTIRGFYIVNPHTGAGPTSDFKLYQYLRVWQEAARTLADAMTPHLSRTLRTIPKPLPSPVPPIYQGRSAGAIDDREAAGIEAGVLARLRAVLVEGAVRHVTSLAVTIDRTVDVVATRELRCALSLGPLGYAKTISDRIGFALGGTTR